MTEAVARTDTPHETSLAGYCRCRSEAATLSPGPAVIHEDSEPYGGCQFPESFLQIVWNEQRLRPGLVTCQGEALEVLNPGTWNVGAGPDFRGAALRLAGCAVAGDVEVHRRLEDWWRHGHDRDPAYGAVVLHVVWHPPAAVPPAAFPCLVLAQHLAGPLEAALAELRQDAYPYARRVAPGRCALRVAAEDSRAFETLLTTAGVARFHDRAERLYRDGVGRGFGQSLYEALFAALGYKANEAPMRSLAAALPLAVLRDLGEPAAREAALLGCAGLLPDPSRQRVDRNRLPRLRQLWDCWWRLGREPVPVTWVRAGARPLNRPERRIVAGAQLLARTRCHPERWLLELAAATTDAASLSRALERELVLACGRERALGFEHSLPAAACVLGRSRARDLVVNVLLPFLYSFGRHMGEPALAARALAAYRAAPPLAPNRRLTEAAHRLLVPPSRLREVARRAVAQQGLLQVYRDFCQTLHGDCRRCPFPAWWDEEVGRARDAAATAATLP